MTAVARPVAARAVGPWRSASARWTARPAANDAALERSLVAAATVAAAAELLLLRLFTRTAIHIPAFENLAGAFHATAAVARYAYYAAVVLVTIALVAVARPRTASCSLERQASAGIAAFVLVALAARADLLPPVVVATAVTSIVVVLGAVVGAARRGWARAAVWCLAGAFGAAGAHGVVQELSGAGLRFDTRGGFLLAAELLAVSAALLAPLAAGVAPTRREGWLAGAVGVATLSALVAAGGSTARVLGLWNFGLGGYLPSVVYATAAAAVTLGLAGRGVATSSRLGAVLLLCGGIGLQSTYQSALVVLGLALLGRQDGQGVTARAAPAAHD